MERLSMLEAPVGASLLYGVKKNFTLKDGLYLNIGYLLNYFIYQVSSLWLYSTSMSLLILWKRKSVGSLADFVDVNSPSNSIIAGDLNIMLAPNEKKGGVVGNDFFHDTVEALIHS